MINAPPVVRDRIRIRSLVVRLSRRRMSKSSEIRSVKLRVSRVGIYARAFLIQKTKMMGQDEKPISIQPTV